MNRITLVLGLSATLLASVVAVVVRAADGPATRPVDASPRGGMVPGNGGGGGGFGGGGAPGMPGFGRWPAPTDEQWAEMSEFARQNMPNRFKTFEALPDDNPAKSRRKGFMYMMYRRIQDLKDEDHKLYDLRVSRLRLEDTIYGEVNQLRSPVVSTDATAIKTSLKQHIGEWIDLGIQERQQRIERLKQSISVEEQKLAEDKAKRNENVEERTKQVIEGDMQGPGGGGGPGGFGGPGRFRQRGNRPRPDGQSNAAPEENNDGQGQPQK